MHIIHFRIMIKHKYIIYILLIQSKSFVKTTTYIINSLNKITPYVNLCSILYTFFSTI